MRIGKRNNIVLYKCFLVIVWIVSAGLDLCLAQSILSGSVIGAKDGNPVAGAFVYAYDGSSMIGFALSTEDGSFVVDVPENKYADRIIVTCLGYQPKTLILAGQDPPYHIVITEQAISIRESKVISSAIVEKGDTLNFTAAAFADGTERVLGDLLGKIPGLSVTKSGGIRYEGDYINKFYVEGLDLMGNRYGVVAKNLSPEMVSRIEIYKHHQPLKTLTGISETDKSAVNIILKKNVKNAWMVTGDALIGVPQGPLFDTKLLVTRFSKKGQDFYLAKGNNAGEDILQELWQQQYFGKTGVFLISENNLDADFQTRLNPVRVSLPLPQEYWYDNLSTIGSFNHLSRIDDDRLLRVSLQMAAEQYCESSSSSEIISFGDGQSMNIVEDHTSKDTKYFVSGKNTYENNSTKMYVKNDFSFSGQIRKNSGIISGGENNGTQLYDLPSLKISNDMDIIFRTSSSRAMAFSSVTKFVQSDHSGNYLTDAFNAHQLFYQNEFVSENGFTYGLSARGVRLRLGGEVNLEHHGLKAELTGLDYPNIRTEASLNLFSIMPRISTEMQFFIGKTEARVSFPIKMNIVSGKGISKTFLYPSFSPSFSMERTFSPSLKVGARVSYECSKTDIENLLPCAVMGTYRTVSYADSLSSRRGLLSILSLKYSDNISMFYATLASSVYLNRANRTSSNQYTELVTITGYKDADLKADNYGVSGSLSKFFGTKTFVAELNGGWQRSDNNLYLQSYPRSYRIDSFNAALSIRMSPSNWFSMDAKTEWKNTEVKGATSSGSNTVTASIAFSLTPFKLLSIMTSAHYRYEDTPGVSISNTPLLKISASWQLKKGTLVAECRNVLNCIEFTRKYVDGFQTVSAITRLQGRQYLLGIRMSL